MKRAEVIAVELGGVACLVAGLAWRFQWWGLIGAGVALCAAALLVDYKEG